MSLSRTARDQVKRLWQMGFELAQRAGVNITPNHFYSDIPDFRDLRRETHWRRPFSMVGVKGAELAPQMAFVCECCAPVAGRLTQGGIHAAASKENGESGYGQGDAAFLYAFIRRFKPARIVQVGCGVSTAVIQMAARDAGYTPNLLCIEPFPNAFLRREAEQGRITLIPNKAQLVDVDTMTGVGPGGLFFVDSTHSLRPGSEVTRIILEVLPRLPAGAWAHFHDITFPYDFHPRVMWKFALFFSHEAPLLHGFLCDNPRFTIEASLSMLHHADAAALQAVLQDCSLATMKEGLYTSEGDYASSIYLRVLS
jgi:hypothetical protein